MLILAQFVDCLLQPAMPQRLALSLLLTLLPVIAVADPGNRVALVVGVADYQSNDISSLSNPVNDAQAIHSNLQQLGFSSRLLLNPNHAQLKKGLAQLGRDSESAALSMFFFAGHGFEIDGSNVMLPRDARLQREPSYRIDKTVPLSEVLNTYLGSSAVKLIVLDACRNDPDSDGNLPVGFAKMNVQTERNTLLVFSTSPGDTAADGGGNNSPFTKVLAKHMMTPDLELQTMLRRVKNHVDRNTGGQLPWSQDSLTVDVILNRAGRNKLRPASPQPVPEAELQTSVGGLIAAQSGWILSAPRQDSIEVYAYGKGTQFASSRRTQDGHWTYVTLSTGAKGYVETSQLTSRLATRIQLPRSRSIRDCEACPDMVLVAPGSFMMGSDQGNPNESPAHRVNIRQPFYMSRNEISIADWQACFDHGGCPQPANSGSRHHPGAAVAGISFNNAQRYAQWLSSRSGKRYRLPSEAEWEYAAQGGSGSETRADGTTNCKRCGPRSARKPLPADGFTANGFGLVHMLGNVFEWVEDCANQNYRRAPNNGGVWSSGNCRQRGIRGGAWSTTARSTRSGNRRFASMRKRAPYIGLRVVRELP